MHQLVQLTGVKRFKGDIEGKHFDSTTLFCLLGLDSTSGDMFGKATAQYKFGTSERFDEVKHLLRNGPVAVVIEQEQVTNGKETKTIVIGIKPAQEQK